MKKDLFDMVLEALVASGKVLKIKEKEGYYIYKLAVPN